MNLDKVKEAARKFEQKEDWRRAIEVYQKAIQEFESGADPTPDVAIYNKVGDLHLKANESAAAVQVFERAVDLYTEQGFFNNGIALCGKILRVNPGRIQVYLKLAQLHARKNVVIDAKKNLIEYIERMSQAKKLDEAFQAMKKFADQFPDNVEIRGMLAELLKAAARSDEGNAELAKLALELDAPPDAGSRKSAAQQRASRLSTAMRNKGDLVFLDVGGDDEEPAAPPPSKPAPAPKPAAAAPKPAAAAPKPAPVAPEPEPELETIELDPAEAAAPEPGLLLETTSLPEVDGPEDAAPALGLEPTMFGALDGPETDAAAPDGLMLDTDAGTDTPAVPGLEPAEFSSPEPADLDLSLSAELDADEAAAPTEELILDAVDDDPAPLIDAAANASHDRSDTALLRSSGELLAVDPDLIEPEPLVELAADDASGASVPEDPVPAGLAFIESEEPQQATIDELEERILDDPDDPERHRALGEALVASGEHSRGNEELELAMLGYEGREDWPHALDIVNELIRIDPSTVRFFQKRVELSFRLGDREHLVEAYVELGDALVRSGALDKAVAVYRRVAEHDPDNARAVAALQSLAPPEEAAPSPPAKVAAERVPASAGRVSKPVPVADDGFVDLGALVMDDDEGPKNTRMRVGDEEPTGDEQKDFQEMLAQFKQGIDKSVDVEDFQTHYDLGVAFKEMGLLDEAIAEFQKALRAPEGRMRASEALGMAFYDKGQFAVAEAILKRAIEGIPGSDDQKLGLLYWLGRADEAQEKGKEARAFYERAMAVDIRFLDAAQRVKQIAAGKGA
ncbi:MAG TPA: tetratricopeptide repeat protein [Gemmatimonadales bacterium]|nr:tetratricopeptide repeat protein [Gemmatimonadales bacterium]